MAELDGFWADDSPTQTVEQAKECLLNGMPVSCSEATFEAAARELEAEGHGFLLHLPEPTS